LSNSGQSGRLGKLISIVIPVASCTLTMPQDYI
jgi:hypothetical protein